MDSESGVFSSSKQIPGNKEEEKWDSGQLAACNAFYHSLDAV